MGQTGYSQSQLNSEHTHYALQIRKYDNVVVHRQSHTHTVRKHSAKTGLTLLKLACFGILFLLAHCHCRFIGDWWLPSELLTGSRGIILFNILYLLHVQHRYRGKVFVYRDAKVKTEGKHGKLTCGHSCVESLKQREMQMQVIY